MKLLGSEDHLEWRLITGIASSSHTVEYTSFGEAVRSLANFHVKQKDATSLSSINSSQRKLSARGSCGAYVIHKPYRDRDSTTGREYHFKGREPSERMLRAVYTWFNTLPPSLYTLDGIDSSFLSLLLLLSFNIMCILISDLFYYSNYIYVL